MTAQPIIIVGMHRSGTSMLAQLLADAGLFLGWRVQPGHQEAYFFQKLNDWVLREASATWDRPAGMRTLLEDDKARAYIVDYLITTMNSPRITEFMGPKRYAQSRSLNTYTAAWGWKDPRSTLTLDLWRTVFPQSKILHVTRHGLDVARSLQVRYGKSIDDYIDRYEQRKSLYRLIARRSNLSTSMRVADLSAGLELWDHYVTEAKQSVIDYGECAMEFRYEDFLADPDPIMRQLLEFCGIPVAASVSWRDRIDADRAFAYRKDPELVEFARHHEATLQRHGYDVTD